MLCSSNAQSALQAKPDEQQHVDEHRWLEQLEDARALQWLEEQNKRTLDTWAATPNFEELNERLLSIYTSPERLAYVRKRGKWAYNYWTDDAHPRGLWRRVLWQTWLEHKGDHRSLPWQVLLDLDALNAKEAASFTWAGASFAHPESSRAIISLSVGGSDQSEKREFDTERLDWVEGGFALPASKASVAWASPESVFVASDLKEEHRSSSGYPLAILHWQRGQELDQAQLIYQGEKDDLAASAWASFWPGYERRFLSRAIDFQNSELFLLTEGSGQGAEFVPVKLELPTTAEKWCWKEWLCILLKEDWQLEGQAFVSGSLLVTSLDSWLAGERELTRIFEPSENEILEDVSASKERLILTTLKDVRTQTRVLEPVLESALGQGQQGQHEPQGQQTQRQSWKWVARELPALAGLDNLAVDAIDPWHSNDLWVVQDDFLQPSRLLRWQESTGELEQLLSLPEFFATEHLAVEQRFARSLDGTRVPYFYVGPKEVLERAEGAAAALPTILYGYGGFEISLEAGYMASVGASWLERGGAFVVANLRGGGEYGARWHRAAIQQKRHKAYEDCAAVARDLISSGRTRAASLGILGGSNGGLLVGNMLCDYPELFGAGVAQVPLLDMLGYTQLPPGASWIAEYGDPAKPEEREFLRRYSPYHKLEQFSSGQTGDAGDQVPSLPPMLLTTSTHDDRVHPGHARKFAARAEQLGLEVYLFENTEGGHGGASTPEEKAFLDALCYQFFWQNLASTPSE